MFKVYDDSNFVINYQDNLEKLVTNFVCYYKNKINELLKKFYLGSIDKMEISLFSDKDLLSYIPYKLGDFAGFFNNNGVNCYININGKKSEDDIIKAIMHEIVHHIYRFYIESDTSNRIIWFDEGLAMNFSLQNDKYNDDDNFKEFLVNKIFFIKSIPCINDLNHGGSFVNDNYNGYGKMTYASGNVYEGEWKNSEMNGHGKYTYANGNVTYGEWENGQFIKKTN